MPKPYTEVLYRAKDDLEVGLYQSGGERVWFLTSGSVIQEKCAFNEEHVGQLIDFLSKTKIALAK